MFLHSNTGLGDTGSRPNKSITSSSRTKDPSVTPRAKSSIPGKVRTCNLNARKHSKISVRRERLAEGIANNTKDTRSLRIKSGKSLKP